MKNTNLFYAVLVLFLALSAALPARETAPTTNLTYIGQYPGGRAMAMGYSCVALTGESALLYFNPSSLALTEKNILSVSYELVRQGELKTDQIFAAETLRNRSLVFLALTAPKGAFSWRPLADSVWTENTATGWKKTEYKVNMYTLSAGNKQNESFCSGLNLSYLTGQIARSEIQNGTPAADISDGSGFCSDIGMLFTPAEQLNFGVVFKNLLGFVWWDDFESEQLPFILRTGFAFKVAGVFTFSSDWEKRYYRKEGQEDDSITHFGAEQALGKYLYLRGGAYGKDLNDKENAHLTLGFGYTINDFAFSIAGERYRLAETDVFKYLFSLDIPMGTKETGR